MLFERVFIGLYDVADDLFGKIAFFDVTKPPPRSGRPLDLMNFRQLISEIVAAYDARNSPPFVWADGLAETPQPPEQDDEGVY